MSLFSGAFLSSVFLIPMASFLAKNELTIFKKLNQACKITAEKEQSLRYKIFFI